jgi:hypothetical protein
MGAAVWCVREREWALPWFLFCFKREGKDGREQRLEPWGLFFLCSLVLFEPRERPSSGWFREKENGGTAWRPVSKRGGSGEEGKEMVVPAGSEK